MKEPAHAPRQPVRLPVALTGKAGFAAAAVRLGRMDEMEGALPRRLRQAIDVPPFGELADPRVLAGVAAAAEERGWDGFFVWAHILSRPPGRALAHPLLAIAAA